MPRKGPRTTVDAEWLVEFLDARTTHRTGGHPVRTRKYINRVPVSANDARMIRRWRNGQVKGVTESTVRALLQRHNIDPREFFA